MSCLFGHDVTQVPGFMAQRWRHWWWGRCVKLLWMSPMPWALVEMARRNPWNLPNLKMLSFHSYVKIYQRVTIYVYICWWIYIYIHNYIYIRYIYIYIFIWYTYIYIYLIWYIYIYMIYKNVWYIHTDDIDINYDIDRDRVTGLFFCFVVCSFLFPGGFDALIEGSSLVLLALNPSETIMWCDGLDTGCQNHWWFKTVLILSSSRCSGYEVIVADCLDVYS